MPHYQAAICRDFAGRYFVINVSEVGNPLRTRSDTFSTGGTIMRMAIAPEDYAIYTERKRLGMPWFWHTCNPRELEQRYVKHAARERTRIAACFEQLNRLPALRARTLEEQARGWINAQARGAP